MKSLLAFFMFCFTFNQVCANSTIKIVPTSPPPQRVKHFHIGAIGGSVTVSLGDIQIAAPFSPAGLQEMLTTATFFQLPEVDVFAIGQTTARNQLTSLLQYINQFGDDEIALIVDGQKSLFLADAPTIFKTFQRIGSDFVIAATRCHQNVGAVHHFSSDARTLNFPDSSSFMGKIDSMKVIVKRLIQLSNKYPDYNLTELFTVDYSEHKESYALDYHALLFLDLCGISPENGDIVIRNVSPYVRVHLNGAHTRPKVVNSEGNMGGGDSLKEDIFTAIFFPPSQSVDVAIAGNEQPQITGASMQDQDVVELDMASQETSLETLSLTDKTKQLMVSKAQKKQQKGCPCNRQRAQEGSPQTHNDVARQRLERVKKLLMERAKRNQNNQEAVKETQSQTEVAQANVG